MSTAIVSFGPVEESAQQQLDRCLSRGGDAARGVLCADHHKGYSMPIGGVLASQTVVMPAGVGYDIACGNCAVRTDLRAADVDVPRIMDEIFTTIAFGVGRVNEERVDHPLFEDIQASHLPEVRALITLAQNQLGTVGSGNHYVDLFEDRADGRLWVGVHFGSRGFGHKIATGFLALAVGKAWGERTDDSMDAPPATIPLGTTLAQDYLAAMNLAGRYAYAGRDWVVDRVLQILGARHDWKVHNHHNFAWWEKHRSDRWLVVRKGATPAFPGQQGFVGGSMGDDAVIVEGRESDASKAALYSTVHGAGRVMGRMEAKGKWRRGVCVRPGKIDWDAALADLREKQIELRGGGADEAPGCYKRLSDVLAYHEGTIKVLHILRPIGVAMAGRDVLDPYRD